MERPHTRGTKEGKRLLESAPRKAIRGLGLGLAAVRRAPPFIAEISAVSLVGALAETLPLFLSHPLRSVTSIASEPIAVAAAWMVWLVGVWIVLDLVQLQVLRRFVSDRLAQRWTADLSATAALKVLDSGGGEARAFLSGTQRLRTAAALAGWFVVLAFMSVAARRAAGFVLAVNAAALVRRVCPTDRLIGGSVVDRGRPVLGRSMRKVSDLRAIGAEAAAFRHLRGQFDQEAGPSVRRCWRTASLSWTSREALTAFACLAITVLCPGSAVRLLAELLLGLRALVFASDMVKLGPASSGSAAPAGMQMSPSPKGEVSSDPTLRVEGIGVSDEGGGGSRSLTFRATLGELTRLVFPNERELRSTAEVLLGLRQAERGRIYLSGMPQDSMPPEQWRTRCAFVPAKTLLVRGVLRENLLVGAPRARPEALVSAVTAASPQGPGSRLLALGDARMTPATQLTVGELRTLSFARALLRQPDLVIVEDQHQGLSAADAQHFDRLVRALAPRCITLLVTASPDPQRWRDARTIVLDGAREPKGQCSEDLKNG